MNVGAVIDAAGSSAGMEDFVRLPEMDSLTAAERVAVNFQRAGIKDIVMITGYRAEQVEKALRRFGITFLRNEDYESARALDSVKLGLNYLRERCGKVLFCPAEVPFFMEETVKLLLEAQGGSVLPVCQGQPGYPVCVDGSGISALLEYQGDKGILDALEAGGRKMIRLEVLDQGILTGISAGEDCTRIARIHEESLMRPQVKVRLVNRKPFFGPGTVTLLKQIDRLGSVKEACGKTGMSYSKGWKIIHAAEEELGYQIVGRQPGGKNGGGAYLTEKGSRLLRLFETYEQQVEEAAYQIYDHIFFGSELF